MRRRPTLQWALSSDQWSALAPLHWPDFVIAGVAIDNRCEFVVGVSTPVTCEQ
jgi:hypothetical protein